MAPNSDGDDPSSIDLHHDRTEKTGVQVDARAYALAGVFGPVALPPGAPSSLKAIVEDRAINLRRAARESGFLNVGAADLINGKTKVQRERETKEGILTYAAMVLREEERQRAEWAKTESTVAGVKMTGAEWAQFAERLRTDDELRRRVIAKFESRGMTEAEANAHYDRIADMAAIADKPPAQRTEAEAERFEHGNADPTARQDLKDMKEMAGERHNAAPAISAAAASDVSAGPKTVAQPVSNVSVVTGPGF